MRNFNLDHLQTLIAIADLGNFAAAAQALHLAPPTVSLHIKELESRLQADLVVRGRRQAELTPPGEVLVQEGRQLLLACDDLMERVRRRASGREGIVRVGVSAGVSTRLLPRMLEALAVRCPGVEIRLEAVGSADSMQRLKAGTLDIGIIASPQPPLAEVRQTPWRNDPMVALLPAAWEAPAFATPDWLATRRWASFAPATQMHGLIANWFGQAGHHPRPFLALSYPGALKSLAVASQCAALLPMEEVKDLQGTPNVQIRPLQPPLMRPMAVAHRHQPPPSPAVEGVLQLLVEFADFGE
ncbi:MULTISPECIES: LysR family transcriptional regulator [Acidovorax]|uniref:LysR family transcriptional regulator n=1 Tax=Acidovorax facilis TaxID=12917 RepID=A0ABV8D5P6_9BURK|nr:MULTISPECIES: LysR family transcriptional regulator [Acidovorax]KQB57228.1 LysR family transcriptional regulator [Acidovorax sp. SD340]MBO1007746.1 LysR family transcriptional regulator [Acidovorax sp. SD340]MCO4241655.1 LysR family transcriptional regulator [Acidovorax facilis]